MPGCSDKNCDRSWIRFDGCWHSFHVDCLKGSSICRGCQSYLKREIRKLSDIAADAIFNPNLGGEQNADTDDENSEATEVQVNEMTDNEIDMDVENLRQIISGLSTSNPLSSTSSVKVTDSSKTKKVSHYRACGHIVEGHKRPKDESVKCPKCPGGLCCSDGKKIQCTCPDHKASQSIADPQQNYERKDNGHITAYQLSVSQADLSFAGLGSNACTAISVYAGTRFLQNNIISRTILYMRRQ